jgi:hypothetical protein
MPVSTITERHDIASRRRLGWWVAGLAALFAFRLLYGLTREFFFEDETQIFLIGLRYYATGHWPFFGPDVVWTRSEIPGALQGLLVGLPLRIWPVPEAPFVLLNLLSFAGWSALAWYITARLPQLPKWLVWGWIMTAPWTLEFSTHPLNPSYMVPAFVGFFIGFFEAVPQFRLGRVPVPLCFALMGAAVPWVMQVHMSWPLLLPYAAAALILEWRSGFRAAVVSAGAFVLGILLTGSLLVPTLATYGLSGGSGGTLQNLRPHFVDPTVALSVLARLFSFPSLEIWRWMATDDGKRQMFLLRHLWIAPLALVVWALSLWQPIWMLREWFRTRPAFPEWRPLKWLIVTSVAIVYASYWFVIEPSQAHAFYVLSPIAFIFAAYCWTSIDSPRWRRIAAGVMAINVAFHVGQALIQRPEISLYRNRGVVAAAIANKQPEMFGHRRQFAIDAGPAALREPSRPWDALKDVQLSDVSLTVGPRRVALWRVTLHNGNPKVAYRDVLYQALYEDGSGHLVEERHDYIKQIFQPGTTTTLEVNDGFVNHPFESATLHVLAAEALLPTPPQ